MNISNFQQTIQKIQQHLQNHKQKAWSEYEKILIENFKLILGDEISPETRSALLLLSQTAHTHGYESGVIGTADVMRSSMPFSVIPSNN